MATAPEVGGCAGITMATAPEVCDAQAVGANILPVANGRVQSMEAVLAAHRKQAAKGTVPGSDTWTPNIWKKYGVNKASFYHALQWEAKHPGCLWSGANFYRRGKIPLLTVSMEDQLAQWIAVTQRQAGGWVEAECVLRVAFALMRSDPDTTRSCKHSIPSTSLLTAHIFRGNG